MKNSFLLRFFLSDKKSKTRCYLPNQCSENKTHRKQKKKQLQGKRRDIR